MKKLTALLLALMFTLSLCVISAMADGYTAGTYEITVDDPKPEERYLNVRAGLPNKGGYSTILGKVWNGEKVEVLEVVDNDWGKISFNGQTGYIRLVYATFVPDDAPSGDVSVPGDTPNTPVEPGQPGDEGIIAFAVLAALSLGAVVVVRKTRA